MTPVRPGSVSNYKVVSTAVSINSCLLLSTSKASIYIKLKTAPKIEKPKELKKYSADKYAKLIPGRVDASFDT